MLVGCSWIATADKDGGLRVECGGRGNLGCGSDVQARVGPAAGACAVKKRLCFHPGARNTFFPLQVYNAHTLFELIMHNSIFLSSSL